MSATHIMAMVSAFGSAALVATSGYDAVVAINTPPMIEGSAVYSEPVQSGEDVLIPWIITKRTPCPGTVSRMWKGRNGFYMVEASRPSSLPMELTPTEYRVQTRIPVLAPAGELQMFIVGEYDCGGEPDRFTLGPVALEVVE